MFAWNQARHWSAGGEKLYCASLVIISIVITFYLISVIELFLSQPTNVTFLPSFSPHPTRVGDAERSE